MATLRKTGRLIVTACCAAAVAATMVSGAVSGWPAPGATLATCPSGEDSDTYTGSCVPYLVPNSPSGASLCPPGVSGSECGSAQPPAGPLQRPPLAPLAPTGPEQQLQDVSTPDF
ncbi:hypothetical protein [[Mycobacterium] fortunisiensis]|uniref:hypothetical protein n=1 Tax=[Mycobacterium] fortunisiensis TaxID=2600579 RepID=UPI001C255D44|nr:hypothetical protein [[Mycobacterium] fortunisiensis]